MKSRSLAIAAGIFLIATCLRAPFTCVPPVVKLVQGELGLSSVQAGLLTTLPLVAFGLLSPVVPLLARRHGLERALFVALLTIFAGIALRTVGAVGAVFVGTGILGAGIAVGNVLLPSLIRRDFPAHVTAMTASFALTMGVASAFGSALAIPLARSSPSTWRFSTGVTLVLPIVAGIVWSFQLRSRTLPAASAVAVTDGGPIWKSAIAWQVTLFLGLNSFVYYAGVAWLPAILRDAGESAEHAGSLHGVLQLGTAIPGLLLVPLLRWARNHSVVAAISALMTAVSLVGLLLAPGVAAVWALLFGLGTGTSIILGLSFVGLRTSSTRESAALSAMAQCVGYLLASVGPTLLGGMHDATGGWRWPLGLCTVLALFMSVAGALAGRPRTVSAAVTA
jgi:CP family cyanate transporter-like MFS transporter